MNSVQTGGGEGKGKSDDEDEELGVSTPNQRNWKGIIMAVLVICFVLGMIVTSVFLLTPPDEGPKIKGERISFEEIFAGTFQYRTFNGTWVSDNEMVFLDPYGGLSLFDVETVTTKILVSNITFRQLDVDTFSISPDMQYILLSVKVKNIFRYSCWSKYYVFNIEAQHYVPLTPTPDDSGHPDLLLAEWSPVGSGIVMVNSRYDIIYKRKVTDEKVHPITDSGIPGTIHNGVPDWVYEEEILNSRKALWFSPDGHKLIYATFNDTLVDEVPIIGYKSSQKYPTVAKLRYPKPGKPNPSVSLWRVDLKNLKTAPMDIKPPDAVKSQDHYFTAVTWVDENKVSVIWMNRAQNTSVITTCEEPSLFCEPIHTEHSNHGWVNFYDPPIFSEDGQSFLIRIPVRDGDLGEFNHVNMYNIRMHRVTPMTHGPFEVTEIIGWDERNDYIYYMATEEDKPEVRHLYRVPDISTPLLRHPECMSCLEADNTTDPCLYNKAHMSKDFSYFVLECLGPDVPRIYLFSTWNGQLLLELDGNDNVRKIVESKAMPQVMTFKVSVESAPQYTARVQLLLPPGFDEAEVTTYPMLVHAYGAPGSQSVNSKMVVNWGTYLASQKNIIYAMIDGRGSGYQGEKLKHEVYENLGSKEVDDQLAVVKYLKKNLHFIDEKRIAIWGWSYGGYVATMALARDADETFNCGIAVAPVITWEQYDSVYAERYMGSPLTTANGNYRGYEAADATKVAGNLKNKKYLLVHGTADDNVHFHHSMMMSHALINEGILFKQMFYTDEDHHLRDVRRHLYKTLDTFLADCFRPSVEELYYHIKKKRDLEELAYL